MGVQESIGFEEIASAVIGSRMQFAHPEIGQLEIVQIDRRIVFPPKTTVFTEGQPAITVYMLTRGTAALYKMEGRGRKKIVGFALPGDFLNSPFEDQHSCSVDAVSEVATRQLSTQASLSHLQAHPASMYWMLEITLGRISAAHEHMLLLGRMTAEERLVEFIIDWRARLGRRGALANLVPLPMSRRDIADYLGLTIETVSRVLGKLEREKVLCVISEGLQLMGSTERPLLFDLRVNRAGRRGGPHRQRRMFAPMNARNDFENSSASV